MKSFSIINLIILISLISTSYAEIRRVPQQYSSIQLAIDNSNIGDTVLIDIGNYLENIVINKSISIIGTNIEGITIKPPFESIPTPTSTTILIENVSGVLIKNIKVYGRYEYYFREGGNSIAMVNCIAINLDSIEAYGGRGSDVLCALQYTSPARDGGHAIHLTNSSSVSVESSILIGGEGGTTIIGNIHCDQYIAKDGYSIYAIDNSVVNIYNNLGTLTIFHDSSSLVNIFTSQADDFTINQIKGFALEQNFPNPFNPITTINYSISQYSFVTLEVYDVLGKKVKTLVSELKNLGNYSLEFNASDLSSGVYLYCLKSNNFISTKKFILIK